MFSLPLRRFASAPRVAGQTCTRMYSSSGSSKPSSRPTVRGGSLAVQSTSSTAKRKSGFAATAVVEEEGESWEHEEAMRRLPAVPNTQYLQPTEVAASSFFALHRPLSIKHAIPQVHSTSAFNSIFDPMLITQENSPAATSSSPTPILPFSGNGNTAAVSGTPSPSTFTTHHPQQRSSKTIERTIMGNVESLISSTRDNWSTGSTRLSSLATAINRANSAARTQEGEYPAEDDFSTRLFSTASSAYIPFHPPPPPVPRTAEFNNDNARPHRQLITIHQTIYPSGMMMFTARSKVIAPITSPYMQRVRERQRENMEIWQERVMEEADRAGVMGEQVSDVDMDEAGDRAMQALSVKRRRALKMKKHKYKKLMKATRNLRRRLEKQ